MQVPRIEKITLNMGVGDAKTDAKALESAIEERTTIAGQRAQVRKARKSIASFKLREGMAVGAKVTLRGARMYEFLDRLVSVALPRIRDFRGLNPGRSTGAATTRSACASRSSSRRSTTTRSRRSGASTSRSRPRRRRTSRRWRCCAPSACSRPTTGRTARMAKTSSSSSRSASSASRCASTRGAPLRPPARGLRKFGLCRICLRELAHAGSIPGMTKSVSVGDDADRPDRRHADADPQRQQGDARHRRDADLADQGGDRPRPQGRGVHQGLPRRRGHPARPSSSSSSSAATASA